MGGSGIATRLGHTGVWLSQVGETKRYIKNEEQAVAAVTRSIGEDRMQKLIEQWAAFGQRHGRYKAMRC